MASFGLPPLAVPAAFLPVTAVGAAFALNARRPLARGGRPPSRAFLAGWLTTELPLHHLAWQMLATAAFAWAGRSAHGPAGSGSRVTAGLLGGAARVFGQAGGAGRHGERALVEALGTGYRARVDAGAPRAARRPAAALAELLLPFAMRRPDVERVRDLPYGPFGRRNMLDVVPPKGHAGPLPRAAPVHGGAWVLGARRSRDPAPDPPPRRAGLGLRRRSTTA